MDYKRLSVMGTNCYLIWDEYTQNAACIDPGFAGRKIAKEIKNFGLHLQYIFLTHSHADHVSGIDDLCTELECSPVIFMSQTEQEYGEFPFKKVWGNKCKMKFWEEQTSVTLDSVKFKIVFTPGHSPGSVCIIADKCLFSGDLLTEKSIGRVDLFGGNADDMLESLKVIVAFPESLKVLPGHDSITTIGEIKRKNALLHSLLTCR